MISKDLTQMSTHGIWKLTLAIVGLTTPKLVAAKLKSNPLC